MWRTGGRDSLDQSGVEIEQDEQVGIKPQALSIQPRDEIEMIRVPDGGNDEIERDEWTSDMNKEESNQGKMSWEEDALYEVHVQPASSPRKGWIFRAPVG